MHETVRMTGSFEAELSGAIATSGSVVAGDSDSNNKKGDGKMKKNNNVSRSVWLGMVVMGWSITSVMAANVYFDTNSTGAGWGVYNGADAREIDTNSNWTGSDTGTVSTTNFAAAGGNSTSTAVFTLDANSFTGNNQYITLNGGTLNIGGLVWQGATVTSRNHIGFQNGTINFATGAELRVDDVQTGVEPDLTFSVSTVGDFTKTGDGIFESVGGTFDGIVTISTGQFQTKLARNLGAASQLVLAGGTEWRPDWTANTSVDMQTVGSLSGSGTLSSAGGAQAGSQRTFVISNGYGQNFAGTIEDNNAGLTVNLLKSGAGTQTLSGTLTYDGTTTVSGGTLLINTTHTTGSLYQVNNGGTLGGTGTIGRDNSTVTVAAGGSLSPGASIGTLTMALGATGELDVSDAVTGTSGAFVFELGTVANSDKLLLSSGVLNIGTGLGFGDFAFTGLAGFGVGEYTLFETGSTIDGTLGTSLTGTINGRSATIAFGDSSTNIILNVVPEPGAFAIVFVGLATLLSRRRRS